MVQVIIWFLRRWAKFGLIIWIIFFIFSYISDYLVSALYHINLSLYYSLGAYLSNNTILMLTLVIVIFVLFIGYKIMKKFI